MRAMVLNRICSLDEEPEPLILSDVPDPYPRENEILVRVSACGVCHTELDEIEGRTPPAHLPVVPGHQVVGMVASLGPKSGSFHVGDRVGIAWIHSACGKCEFCEKGLENLCEDFIATGRDVNGGYAEYMTVPELFAYPIPDIFSDFEAAPLLCAGAVGYRSLTLTGMRNGDRLGLSGFGASAHIVLQIAKYLYPDSRVYAFSRTQTERDFSLELGADWAGNFGDDPGEKLEAIIDTTPAWKPVTASLRYLTRGGRLVINAIRKEDGDRQSLSDLYYARDLWMEKEIKSVANVTRRDVLEFLKIASQIPIRPEVEEFSLEDANIALSELKQRKIRGAKVLRIG
jgi:alcohol dehydrogenase, propanol-preferring